MKPGFKLVITVEDIKGRCPAYKKGDKIVLDRGYKFNLQETTACCMHGLGPIMPFYCALAKGIPPKMMGLAPADNRESPKAYIHCPDPCEKTGGGTVLFSVERVEEQ
ncbi:MAG: TIGR04076 family protein [Planctomycetes bacterium]|nr:TIGR04076 family protein [Planctomycetota bacterium]